MTAIHDPAHNKNRINRHAPHHPQPARKRQAEWGETLGAQMIVVEIVGAVLIALSLLAMVETDTRVLRQG